VIILSCNGYSVRRGDFRSPTHRGAYGPIQMRWTPACAHNETTTDNAYSECLNSEYVNRRLENPTSVPKTSSFERVMYTKLFYRVLGFGSQLTHYVGCNPLLWNYKEQRFYFSPQTKRRCIYHTILVLTISILFGIRAYQAHVQDDLKHFNMAMTYFYASIAVGISLVNCALKAEELHLLYNGFISYSSNFYRELCYRNYRIRCFNCGSLSLLNNFVGKWMVDKNPENNKRNRYRDYAIVVLLFSTIILSLFCLLHYILYPDSVYPFGLLPLSLQDNLFLYLVIGVYSCFAIEIAWMTLLFLATIVGSCFYFFLGIAFKDLNTQRGQYITRQALRDPKSLMKVCRELEILHKLCMDIFGILVIALQAVITQVILMTNYTIIRHWNRLDEVTIAVLILFTAVFQTVWFTILTCGGLYHVHSGRTLKSWKYLKFSSKEEAKMISKFRKSCRPLGIGLVGYFISRRLTVLKFMRGVVRGTFRALLALKKA